MNSQSFTPDDIKAGLFTDLIRLLMDFNTRAEGRYMEIHITSDSYCTIVEWECVPYDHSYGGKFEYIGGDEQIFKEVYDKETNTYLFKPRN